MSLKHRERFNYSSPFSSFPGLSCLIFRYLAGRFGQGTGPSKNVSTTKKENKFSFVQSGTETQHPGHFEFLAGLILNETKQLQGTANAFFI